MGENPLKVVKLRGQKVECWLPKTEGGRDGEILFGGYRVPAGEGENNLATDGGHGCTIMWSDFLYLML